MYKAEALIVAQQLESILKYYPAIVRELKILQGRILEGKAFESGVSYGRMQCAIQKCKITEVSDYMSMLYEHLTEKKAVVSEKTLDDLKLGVRLSNYCKRAGINTVKDFYDVQDLKSIFPKHGDKYYQDLIEKLNNAGIKL